MVNMSISMVINYELDYEERNVDYMGIPKVKPLFEFDSIEYLPTKSDAKILFYREKMLFKKKYVPRKIVVPLSEKYTLSIDEAALYFGIGQNRLRSIVASYPDADYLITVGAKTLIKRKKFEQYIDDASAI